MNRNQVWKKGAALLAALTLTAALAACGQSKDGGKTASGSPSAAPASPTAAASTAAPAAAQTKYPLTIKDATGTDVTFDKAPERIVSISPSETEVLYSIGAGAKIVAVDDFSDYPADVKSKPKLGGQQMNVEALLAQKADVVFANSSVNKKQVEQLRGMGVKVFGSDPKTIEQVIERVELYGQIFNAADGAKKQADLMRSQQKQVVDAVKGATPKRVYIEFSPGYTVSKGVFMDDLITLAGGVNVIKADKPYLQVDPEAVVKANPEVILYGKDTVKPDEIKKRPGWENIDAIKNNRIYAIDDNLLSRVSPRITETLIQFGKAIQPDKVK